MRELQVDFETEGVVKGYNTTTRYGFITPVGGEVTQDIFVDGKCVRKSGLQSLKEGSRVKCIGSHRGEKGPKAKRVEVLS